MKNVVILLLGFMFGYFLSLPAQPECESIEHEIAALYEQQDRIEQETADISYYLSDKYSLSVTQADFISDSIVEVSRIYNVPATLLAAIANAESTFNPKAKSNMGARGLMQVMPFWVKDEGFRKATGIINKEQLYNPRLSLHAGAYILSQYIKEGGSVEKGILAYHGGTRAWSTPRQSTLDYYAIVSSNFERI